MKAEITLSFDQLLKLVKQLPKRQKIKLTAELEKDAITSRLRSLLSAFSTNQLDSKTVEQEVEAVRQQIYDKNTYLIPENSSSIF